LDLGLIGRKALVSGGTHGIGRAIAEGLAREGAAIALFSRNEENVNNEAKRLEALGVETLPIVADALVPADVHRVATSVNESWGGVDILVNNVGGGGRWGPPGVFEADVQVWKDVYQKNVMAAVSLMKDLVPPMRARGWGRVICITSTLGTVAGGRPWFNVAKSAMTVLMKNLASNPEFSRSGVTFNSVAPGAVLIPDTGWASMRDEKPTEFAAFLESLPLGRLGRPEEVADLVTFLCSPRAALVNGASVLIDGGETSHMFVS